ncbi:hypothetical protein [Streptomyces europaeiscabiei]|uniref:hypothetical protein n=1 Tax=Streptomyces europaeiscabiei TaxID=146819 RepID=UPI002E266EAF|nr:hypothetical protein OG858_00095 [Streptomyces europaeiscabiei]WUD38165.1 hypothetical protein OG858_46790 [Streptomyces europaeiscabiei]
MKISRRPALSEDERLAALGCLLTDTEIPMRLRAVGVIVLLYAQPLSRVVRLTADDVVHDGDAVLLRLGEPASPVPAPVTALLLEHLATRSANVTALFRGLQRQGVQTVNDHRMRHSLAKFSRCPLSSPTVRPKLRLMSVPHVRLSA